MARLPGRVAAGTVFPQASFPKIPQASFPKTGSPQANGVTNATFICYAPAEDPEIAIAVVIENGASGPKAAPVAVEILDEYFGFNSEESGSYADESALLP